MRSGFASADGREEDYDALQGTLAELLLLVLQWSVWSFAVKVCVVSHCRRIPLSASVISWLGLSRACMRLRCDGQALRMSRWAGR